MALLQAALLVFEPAPAATRLIAADFLKPPFELLGFTFGNRTRNHRVVCGLRIV
jgi:hypothetical protein